MPFPMVIPHSDGAGIIEAVGTDVDPARVGERAWLWNARWQRPSGTAAEFVALPSAQAVALPDGVPFDVGASLGIPALTACHCVLGDGPVEGRSVLVSGGAGTVGRLAVQLARTAGARVIATAHGDDAMERARSAGADAVLDYRDGDLLARILDANRGRPIDRVVEVEFGANVETIASTIREGGRIAAYGSARDLRPALPFYPLMFKAVNLEFVLVYILDEERRQRAIDCVNAELAAGRLDVPVQARFPLEDCAAAHEAVEAGGRAGAVVVEIP